MSTAHSNPRSSARRRYAPIAWRGAVRGPSADEKLFEDEEGFFDLAAELEEELSKEELLATAAPLQRDEPSLEEIVEGFKKGVAESLSAEDYDTHFNLGMLSRFMTDYGGPLSTVRRIQLQMKRTIGAGEDYMMSGVITRKYQQGGENLVDMDIRIDTELGPGYVCSGTLALP